MGRSYSDRLARHRGIPDLCPAVHFDLAAGFRWAHVEHPAYERMIIAVYFALGVAWWRRYDPAARHPD
jgi:hypothetical protein